MRFPLLERPLLETVPSLLVPSSTIPGEGIAIADALVPSLALGGDIEGVGIDFDAGFNSGS